MTVINVAAAKGKTDRSDTFGMGMATLIERNMNGRRIKGRPRISYYMDQIPDG